MLIGLALSLAKSLLGFAQKRSSDQVERFRIETGLDETKVKAGVELGAQAASVVRSGMQFRVFWIPWSLATVPLAMWFGWGMLDSLANGYRCYALVRNPLAVLASWNEVDIKAREGRSPTAEAMDPELARELGSLDDAGARQLRLLAWFFERYRDTLPAEAVIRYEDAIASGGAALSPISEAAAELKEPLENRNESELYDPEFVRTMGERLLCSEGAYWDFYSRESVEELL